MHQLLIFQFMKKKAVMVKTFVVSIGDLQEFKKLNAWGTISLRVQK